MVEIAWTSAVHDHFLRLRDRSAPECRTGQASRDAGSRGDHARIEVCSFTLRAAVQIQVMQVDSHRSHGMTEESVVAYITYSQFLLQSQ